jgi:hypothetical protein
MSRFQWLFLVVLIIFVNTIGILASNGVESIKNENYELWKENNRLVFRLQGITKILYTEYNSCVLCHVPYWTIKV